MVCGWQVPIGIRSECSTVAFSPSVLYKDTWDRERETRRERERERETKRERERQRERQRELECEKEMLCLNIDLRFGKTEAEMDTESKTAGGGR